jgi:hypothetical protein
VDGDAAFTDIENNSAVIGPDIEIGEGFHLVASTDAPLPPIERVTRLRRHWCHWSKGLAARVSANQAELSMILRLYNAYVTRRFSRFRPAEFRNGSQQRLLLRIFRQYCGISIFVCFSFL